MVNTGRALQPRLVYNLRISAFFIALNAAIKKKYNIVSQKIQLTSFQMQCEQLKILGDCVFKPVLKLPCEQEIMECYCVAVGCT